MALSINNCYVTRSDADTYFSDRLESDAWSNAEDLTKDQALVTATQMLDDLTWSGIVANSDQPLAFPRSGSYFDPRKGYIVAFPDDIPDSIKVATYELALHLLSNDGLLSSTGSVTDLEVGPIKLKEVRSPPKVPMFVNQKIRAMLLNGGSRLWYRAW